ncbi:MAG: alpha-galactosidase [Phycisphaeraceae bacterium]|nr:alpha-galactosidase [Phycisphaeraceae bacterium]
MRCILPRHLRVLYLALILVGSFAMQTTFAGPLPTEMAAWDETTKQAQRDAGRKMLAEIDAAVKRGEKQITVAKAHYRFDKTIGDRNPMHILWEDMVGVTLDFSGSTFWFENQATGIFLKHNSDCTVKNVTLDWDPLPYVQGRIMAIDHKKQHLHVKLDDGYDQPNDAPLVSNPKARWRGLVFDPATRKLKDHVIGFSLYNNWGNRTPEGYQITSFRGFYGIKLKDSGIAVGDDIAMVKRKGRAVRIEFCHNNTMQNITLHASGFVGFVQKLGTGSAMFRNIQIVRRPETNRLISCNADGININNMENGPLLDNCKVEYLGDDCVNVHSAYNRVVWQNSSNQLTMTPINPNAAGKANSGKPVKIVFFDRKTMSKIGERMVTAVKNIDAYPLDQSKILFDLKDNFHSGDAARFNAQNKTAQACVITLDNPITITGDVVTTCPEYISAGAVIRNCHFSDTIARGIRLQGPHALIENNVIQNTRGFGLSMSGQPSFWGEGPYVHSTIAQGNTFINCANDTTDKNHPVIMVQQQGDYTTNFTQYDITLKDNLIKNAPTMGIMVRGIKDLTITGNTIDGYYTYPNLSEAEKIPAQFNGTGYGIVVESCENVTLKENTVINPGKYAKGTIFTARNK